ncbi:MAG: wax ester/triacylglycerol synthase family O-acyltransferase [Parahaliea sp.]
MRQLNPIDATFLLNDTERSPSNASSIWVYQRKPRQRKPGFNEVFAHIRRCGSLLAPFRMKLAHVPAGLDRPWWVEDDRFDLRYHARSVALPQPGNWDAFRRLVSDLHAAPLDLARPLWELYVIEGLDEIAGLQPNAFAVLLKAHHAAMDGKASLAITKVLHDAGSAASGNESGWAATQPPPSSLNLLGRGTVNLALKPLRSLQALAGLAPGLSRQLLHRERRRGSSGLVPRTRFNGEIGAGRIIDTCFVELDKLKRIRRRVHGATLNDVALTVFGGALRRYLALHSELPEAPLRAMTPVALRSEAGREEIGNNITGMVVTMASDIEDPLERLAVIAADSEASKRSMHLLGMDAVGDLLDAIPAPLMATGMKLARQFGRLGLTGTINTVVSNAAGSRETQELLGAPMVLSTGAGPLMDGIGLLNYMTSYADTAAFGYTACSKMMPDSERYTQCINESIDDAWKRAVADEGTGPQA